MKSVQNRPKADYCVVWKGNPVVLCVELSSSLAKYLYLLYTQVSAKKIGVACA